MNCKVKINLGKNFLVHTFYLLVFIIYFTKFSLANDNFDKFNFPKYALSFKYYDYNLKSNVEYFLFDNFQEIVDYTNNKIYLFPLDQYSFNILNELYNLKGKELPIYYYPPIPRERLIKNKLKNNPAAFGTIAYLKKYYEDKLQVMYLYDYATPNFYKYIDPLLASLIYPLEDNIKVLINQIMILRVKANNEQNNYKEYTDFLNYLKAFNNLNKPEIILYEAFYYNNNFYFKFLDTKYNTIKSFKINEYKVYRDLGSYYFKDVDVFKL